MIRTWWQDGVWGGVPVRRLAHVMADVINACEQARVPWTRVVEEPVATTWAWELDGDEALVVPAWQGRGGAELELPATAAAFNGMSLRDPCVLHNFREALRFLVGITEVDPSGHGAGAHVYYVGGATSTEPPTTTALGIDGLTEDSLARPQEVGPWAMLRDALEALRYLRVVIQNNIDGVSGMMAAEGTTAVGEGGYYGAIGDSSTGERLNTANQAIASAITNEDTGQPLGGIFISDKVSATATWNFAQSCWVAQAAAACFESVTLRFRVANEDLGTSANALPDLPVTRAAVRFADGGTVAERVTSADVTVDAAADTLEDGTLLEWTEEKDDVVIAFVGTRTDEISSMTDAGGGEWRGSAGFCFMADQVAVTYDLDAVEEA